MASPKPLLTSTSTQEANVERATLSRRAFWRLAGASVALGPTAAELVVSAAVQAASKLIARRSYILPASTEDLITLATLRYIKANPKIVDGVFMRDPVLTLFAGTARHQHQIPAGRTIETSFDVHWG